MVILDTLANVLIFIALMIIVNILTEAAIRGVLKVMGKNPDDYLMQLNFRLDEIRKQSPNYSSFYDKSFSKNIETVNATIKHKYSSSRMNACTIVVNGCEEELRVTAEEWGRLKIEDEILVDVITSTNLINTDDVRKTYKLSERGAAPYLNNLKRIS